MHGGVGGGLYSQGQPNIQELINQLALQYEIDIYSQLPPNDDFHSPNFRIFSLKKNLTWSIARWAYLIIIFCSNNFKNRYDILYSFWGYPAGLIVVILGKLLGKPTVIHLQGGDAVNIPALRYGVFYKPLTKDLCRWAYKNASLLIALTAYQKDCLEREGVRRQIAIIPYGPDLHHFQFNRNRFDQKIARFIHIGNHTPVKNQQMLLESFRKISTEINSTLTIIGFDALDGALKRYSSILGIENLVVFTGPVPYAQIPEFLSKADVLLHTSFYEGQGVVISEAAACGVLLAGTRVGLLADLGDRCGVLGDTDDPEGLAEKVCAVLEDPAQINAYINRSRQWVEEHDSQWTVKTILSHLKSLTGDEQNA